MPAAPTAPPPPRTRPEIRPRRQEPRRAFAAARLRQNPLLRACAVLAFLQYGALLALLFSGALHFWVVGTLIFFSLGSWFFLFLWYPFLETMIGPDVQSGTQAAFGQILESLAILCVAAVHVMLLLVLGSQLR